MKIQAGAILTSYRRKADKSVSITFNTAEQTPQQLMQIDSLMQQSGVLYFRAVEALNNDEVNQLDNVDLDLFDNKRTLSQMLRAVLHVWYNQDSQGHENFKEFYKYHMNILINHIKNKLEQ